MNTKSSRFVSVVLAGVLACAPLACAPATLPSAANLKSIQLPKPQTDGGKPLMKVLKNRKSMRKFSTQKLPNRVLSNLLWAAWGISRPESGKRTAPSAMNKQEVDIYVATADGAYLYDAKAHQLKQILTKDLRAATGEQEFVASAPVNLVYVLDMARGVGDEDEAVFCAAISTGCIIQNVYLFCTSEGLATVVRGSVNGPALAKAMGLRKDQRVLMAQTVGYPAK
jgi:SagB-type dehydrogenase family enzyme